MLQANTEWKRIFNNIMQNGVWQEPAHVRAKWADGTPAPAIFVTGEKMIFDNSEALMITDKQVGLKGPLHEGEWIWVDKTNNVQTLRDRGSDIWDEWEIKEGPWAGTIGPAYGYQLARRVRRFDKKKIQWDHLKPSERDELKWAAEKTIEDFILLDQVDFTIQGLLTNPGSRRYVTTLIDIAMLDQMALEPCVWRTNLQYVSGKLNAIIGIRSNDMCLGNPFNIIQYQTWQRKLCQVTGIEVGTIQFDIENAHVYDRHIEEGTHWYNYKGSTRTPQLILNPNVKNFYEFDVGKDIKIENYDKGPKRHFEVAE